MPIPVILDTDMDTDCDDAGALAVIHALARRGEACLVAAICDAPSAWGPDCIRAINAAYGVDVPVGAVLARHRLDEPRYADYRQHLAWIAGGAGITLYNERVARAAGARLAEPVDAVAVYRRALADADDGSVAIVAVGLLTALADLLDSPPDAISPLAGERLVALKARSLTTMGGGSFPRGYDGFNWRMDRAAAARVLNGWPTPLVVNELGGDVLTGASLAGKATDHPVRLAYEIFLGGVGRSRPSWDLITALHAIHGASALLSDERGYFIEYDGATGMHRWLPAMDGPERRFLRQRVGDAELAKALEVLLAE